MNLQRTIATAVVWVSVALLSAAASAGTYRTITIDDDHSDWVGVPVLDSDPADNPGSIDIAETQIANDDDFLYIRNTFHGSLSLNLFTGIDVDEDVATGFDIFGLGLIGQDSGWQTDFPFTSSNGLGGGVFNDGFGMTGDFFGSGAALIDAFVDSNERELAISLDIIRNGPGTLVDVFPDDTVRLLFWSDQGQGEVSGVINYTLAVVPEPASFALLCMAASCGVAVRQRD
ncbi:MAG: PEP-CTERM sorting domain-containing protein [Planctomycetota bacterium]